MRIFAYVVVSSVVLVLFLALINAGITDWTESNTYMYKLMGKILENQIPFTSAKAIKIINYLEHSERCHQSSFMSISDRASAMDMNEIANLCDSTRDQFIDACDLFLKLCSPPLDEKMDDTGYRMLASLLSRLITLHHSAVDLDVDVFTPLEGLEATKAAQQVAESCSPSLLALHDESISILADLNAVLEVTTTAFCASLPSAAKPSVKHAKTAYEQVLAAAEKCRSINVKAEMSQLIPQLSIYTDSLTESTDTTNRINTYYLPALVLVLHDLATAEKKNSKTVPTREELCLQAITTVRNILNTYQDTKDTESLSTIKAEVASLQNFAAIKGDIPSYPSHLQTDEAVGRKFTTLTMSF